MKNFNPGEIVSFNNQNSEKQLAIVIKKSDYYKNSYVLALHKPIFNNQVAVVVVLEDFIKRCGETFDTCKMKIINYMNWKNTTLHESYFTEKDKQDILSWNSEDAKTVWKTMMVNLDHPDAGDIFGTDFCPFCIYNDILENSECESCSYGKNHGLCDNQGSDWQLFIKPLRNDYHRNLIKEYLISVT
jgi:hypothetical protein